MFQQFISFYNELFYNNNIPFSYIILYYFLLTTDLYFLIYQFDKNNLLQAISIYLMMQRRCYWFTVLSVYDVRDVTERTGAWYGKNSMPDWL